MNVMCRLIELYPVVDGLFGTVLIYVYTPSLSRVCLSVRVCDNCIFCTMGSHRVYYSHFTKTIGSLYSLLTLIDTG